jgi:hypothetical protein
MSTTIHSLLIGNQQPEAEKKSRVAWHAGLVCGATREALDFFEAMASFA